MIRRDIPYYDKEEDTWKCEFPDRELVEESGCLEYVISEFIWDGLNYHYYINGNLDHEHTFREVLIHVLSDYETFSINGYEEDYSKQEIRIIKKLIDELRKRTFENKGDAFDR